MIELRFNNSNHKNIIDHLHIIILSYLAEPWLTSNLDRICNYIYIFWDIFVKEILRLNFKVKLAWEKIHSTG